jgi:predicted phage baseplate assembly protein
MVEYKTGGGRRTNLPAGAVQKLDRAIGFINQVSNPTELSGGYDVEALSEAIGRSSALLRTQGKAVTARDFEELVKQATRNVEMAKCFAGYDGNGHKKPGAVTLVVLRKDYRTNRTRFASVREEIYKYLEQKVHGNLIALNKLFIIEPKFVELRVRAEIRVSDMNKVFAVKKSVQERLDRFMDVVNGNFDGSGWKIGRLPNEIQIRNAIIDIDGIEYVKNIFLTAFTGDVTGWKETDMELIKTNRFVLPLSGEHEILISVV